MQATLPLSTSVRPPLTAEKYKGVLPYKLAPSQVVKFFSISIGTKLSFLDFTNYSVKSDTNDKFSMFGLLYFDSSVCYLFPTDHDIRTTDRVVH